MQKTISGIQAKEKVQGLVYSDMLWLIPKLPAFCCCLLLNKNKGEICPWYWILKLSYLCLKHLREYGCAPVTDFMEYPEGQSLLHSLFHVLNIWRDGHATKGSVASSSFHQREACSCSFQKNKELEGSLKVF